MTEALIVGAVLVWAGSKLWRALRRNDEGGHFDDY
jgi:hypothetical protein